MGIEIIKKPNENEEETFAVRPVGKRMRCPKCKLGYMQLDPTGQVIATYPPQLPHKCDKCGYTTSYRKTYPCIEFEPVPEAEKNVEENKE